MSYPSDSAAYVLSEDDHVRANQLYSKLSRRQWMWYLAGAGVLMGVAILAPWQVLRIGALFGLLGGILGHLLTRHLVAPWQTRRHYKSYPAAHERVWLEVREEGLRLRTESSDSLVKWKHILKWRQDEHFVLVFQSPRLYHPLPKALEGKGFDVSALVSALQDNVGNAS